MSSLINKLNKTEETKTNIKQAIEAGGVPVGEAPFSKYHELVSQLTAAKKSNTTFTVGLKSSGYSEKDVDFLYDDTIGNIGFDVFLIEKIFQNEKLLNKADNSIKNKTLLFLDGNYYFDYNDMPIPYKLENIIFKGVDVNKVSFLIERTFTDHSVLKFKKDDKNLYFDNIHFGAKQNVNIGRSVCFFNFLSGNFTFSNCIFSDNANQTNGYDWILVADESASNIYIPEVKNINIINNKINFSTNDGDLLDIHANISENVNIIGNTNLNYKTSLSGSSYSLICDNTNFSSVGVANHSKKSIIFNNKTETIHCGDNCSQITITQNMLTPSGSQDGIYVGENSDFIIISDNQIDYIDASTGFSNGINFQGGTGAIITNNIIKNSLNSFAAASGSNHIITNNIGISTSNRYGFYFYSCRKSLMANNVSPGISTTNENGTNNTVINNVR